MTVPALAAVGGRICEIQSSFSRIVPQTTSFADTLQAAERSDDAAQPSMFSLAPQATPSETAYTPVGILGTEIIVRSGAATGESWKAMLPTSGRSWATEIESAANDAGLDPRLLAAMVWQESAFQSDAVSQSGAIGLAQLMPGTSEGLGVDPWDPVENLDGGARYLAWTIEEFGSIELGLAAYNAGPGRVREAGGIPNIAETRAYVPRVLDYYRQLGGVA